MAKPTDDYCVNRFFEVFATLPSEQRRGIITGLRATDRVMEEARPAQPAKQLVLLEPPQPEPDSEGGEED